ncbi:hypothetical protein ACLKA7_002849 [Drosophila subpalustris]
MSCNCRAFNLDNISFAGACDVLHRWASVQATTIMATTRTVTAAVDKTLSLNVVWWGLQLQCLHNASQNANVFAHRTALSFV